MTPRHHHQQPTRTKLPLWLGGFLRLSNAGLPLGTQVAKWCGIAVAIISLSTLVWGMWSNARQRIEQQAIANSQQKDSAERLIAQVSSLEVRSGNHDTRLLRIETKLDVLLQHNGVRPELIPIPSTRPVAMSEPNNENNSN